MFKLRTACALALFTALAVGTIGCQKAGTDETAAPDTGTTDQAAEPATQPADQ